MNKINNNCSSLLKSKLIKDSLKKKHQNENIIQSKNKINNSKLENYIKNFLQKKKKCQ